MDKGKAEREFLRILAGTLHGTVEGNLRASSRLRTLDYLNRRTVKFLTLQDCRVTSAHWQPEGPSCSISLSSILWVSEVGALRSAGERRTATLQNRAAVRFCLPGCEVLGFLHAPVQGDPIVRLNQDQNAFLALTSVSVVGEDTEFSTAFLAVNRSHVFAAEPLAAPDANPAGIEAR